jgi:tripartite-type tricarboxylate transporter receptor subunit TctC
VIKQVAALLVTVLAFSAFAGPAAVHTNGDGHSRVLAQILFPDAPVIPSPGADGLFVWKKLDGNKTDVAIQPALAVHFLPLSTGKEDYAATHDLLATLATTRQVLMARSNSSVRSVADIKKLGKPATVGWIGNACSALLKDVFAAQGVELVYVPYKTPQEATAAFLGGHIDYICPVASSLQQLTDNGAGKIVVDLTEHHKFALTTNVFISKDMPEATRQALLRQLTRSLSQEDLALAKTNGFVLDVRTGDAAKKIFDRDREAWRRIVAGQTPTKTP